MNSPFAVRHGKSSGFTLIELLVVISIIAILAGLLLPVISSVVQNAHKTEAKSTEVEIVTAVKNYETEYGQYPVEPQATAIDATFDNNAPSQGGGLYGHNYLLFSVLRATNSSASGPGDAAYKALNSRQIVYFEGKDVKNVGAAASGFIPVNATGVQGNTKNAGVTLESGDLVDPWGNLYYVRIDGNYTGIVMNPYQTSTVSDTSGQDYSTDPTVLRLDVIAWTVGYDGQIGAAGQGIPVTNYGDDVLSWQ